MCMSFNKKYILKMDYMHPLVLKKLRKKKFIVIEEEKLNKEHYKKIEAVILDVRNLDFKFFDKFEKLKFIARFGVGYDNINLKYLLNRNIKLGLTYTSVIRPVAEHTIALIFSIIRKLKNYDILTRKLYWNKHTSNLKFNDIIDKKIFLIGYGKIGKKVANLLQAFGCKLYFYDPKVKKYNKNKIKKIGLIQGLKKADIVSLHIPLNKFNHKFFNDRLLNFMRPRSILINTSRGKIIDEKSLINKLIKHKDFYAGIDVFYEEPIRNKNKLIKLNNVLLTPHISTSSEDARLAMSEEVFQNLVSFFKKKKSKNFLNIKKNFKK